MAHGFDQAAAKEILDHIHGVAAMTMPTELRLRLLTAMGDADTYGTEALAGGGYTPASGAPILEYGAATLATPSVSATTSVVTVLNWPRAESLVGGEIWASAPTVKRLEWGDFDTPIALGIGDTLTIAAGDVSAELQ